MFRVSCKVFLIAVACLIGAARLQGRGVADPLAATQEVNRCLSVLRAAAGAKSLQDATSKRTRRARIYDF